VALGQQLGFAHGAKARDFAQIVFGVILQRPEDARAVAHFQGLHLAPCIGGQELCAGGQRHHLILVTGEGVEALWLAGKKRVRAARRRERNIPRHAELAPARMGGAFAPRRHRGQLRGPTASKLRHACGKSRAGQRYLRRHRRGIGAAVNGEIGAGPAKAVVIRKRRRAPVCLGGEAQIQRQFHALRVQGAGVKLARAAAAHPLQGGAPGVIAGVQN